MASCSKKETPESRHVHTISFPNFSAKMKMESRESLTRLFTVSEDGCDTLCYLLMYPNGRKRQHAKHVSLYLGFVKDNPHLMVTRYSVSVQNKDGLLKKRR